MEEAPAYTTTAQADAKQAARELIRAGLDRMQQQLGFTPEVAELTEDCAADIMVLVLKHGAAGVAALGMVAAMIDGILTEAYKTKQWTSTPSTPKN